MSAEVIDLDRKRRERALEDLRASQGPLEAIEATYRAAGLWPSAVAIRAIVAMQAELSPTP